MQRHILIGLGTFCITVGIVSFLVESISNSVTLALLVIGAAATVKGSWFS